MSGPQADSFMTTVVPMPLPGWNLKLSFSGDMLVSSDYLSSSNVVNCFDSNPTIDDVVNQLQHYFVEPRAVVFDMQLRLQGTEFQRSVWQLLREIPVGETRSYGDLAKQLNTSPRAVGNACRANPIPLIVPCHRVVSASGVGGFMGQRSGGRVALKEWLLRHEQAR